MDNEPKNYIAFKDCTLFSRSYAYIDVADYLADDIFEQYKIKVRFGKEMWHPDHAYKVIFCKVYRHQEHKFLIAMEKLKDKMLLCGHGDYLDYCGQIQKAVQDELRRKV